MNKNSCDRIVVSSNEKMGKIIRWYLENQSWIDQEEFHAPLESGMIVLEEEGIEVTFESKGSVVELSVYPDRINIPAMTYDYNPITKKFSNYRFPAHLTPERRKVLEEVAKVDRTDYKESIKYHSLMMFAAYYEDFVTVDEKLSERRTKHEAKKLRRSKNQPLALVKKTYILREFEEGELRKHGEKRRYTKPDHEVQVRGFFRKNRNGNTSWVKPFSRYKDKGSRGKKEYRV